MRHVVLAFIFLLGAQAATAQQLDSKAKLLAGANTVFAGMCTEHRGNAERAGNLVALRLAKEGIKMWCSCGPIEMERLVAGLSEPISKETALSTYTQATSICAGKQIRAATMAACAVDSEVAARTDDTATYCACVGSKLSAMTDEQLNNELSQAYEQEMRDAQAQGREPGFRESFALRKYGAGCETARKS